MSSKSSAATSAVLSSSSVNNDNSHHMSFVDYTPEPKVKVLPPAKYKLWLIIFVLVYFAVWVSTEAEMRQFLEFNGWLSYDASNFLSLAIIVFVIVYAAYDIFQYCLTFRTGSGKVYGVEAWLKQPRAHWMYQHENLLYEVLLRAIHILENGFAMFDSPPPAAQTKNDRPKQFDCTDSICETVLKIEHRIRPDKLADYHKWVVRINRAVGQANGYIGTDKTEIQKEWDEEKGAPPVQAKAGSATSMHQVIYLKFANVDYLNDWMLSPRKKALMKALEPMLAQPDVVQIQNDRALPDGFSDLLARQGQSVPKSPPKKWKVWWLTLLALFVTIRWSGSFLPFYFDKWGVSSVDMKLQRLVQVFIVTFLNSYVMTPLFLFVFDHWVKHDDSKNLRQPWKTFDEGFQSMWLKAGISFAFYGGCLIALLVKKNT